MKKSKKRDALSYHSSGRPGKIEVIPTKPYSSQRDLALAYSPGVAEPCLAIAENEDDAYKYTAKGNLVAVISNGTAVLGLGDIGPLASKPVMEGKGLLFKIFADIDVFDIEVDSTDIEDFVQTVKNIAPTFGGINLEDLKAPEAFEIERRLKEELDIPVMHDDQHGTAIISGAALINALELAEKKIQDVRIVVSGAGASAMSCAKFCLALGARKDNVVMLDSKGVIQKSRKNLTPSKEFFASDFKGETLTDAMKDADVFLGLSTGNIVTKEMVQLMAPNPIVFALANPEPEIPYEEAIAARDDIIMATGRSDHPNQVNNVLGFPFIFRGALDVQAKGINEEMKLAAAHAIARLAKEPVPVEVNMAYNESNLSFGRDFIIPKPMDHRLITTVAPAVAKAAMDSGLARNPIKNWKAYRLELIKRLGLENKIMDGLINAAKRSKQRVVFAEADTFKILKAAQTVREEGIAIPILLGEKKKINRLIADYELDMEDIEIIDPRTDENLKKREQYGALLYEKRKRKGFTLYEAVKAMRERNYFGAAMVAAGEADAFISGLTRNYPDTLRPPLQIIGKEDGVKNLVGMYVVSTKRGPIFLADTTINFDPTAQELAEIAIQSAKAVKRFNIKPVVAMLSYSNFGSSRSPSAKRVAEAVRLIKEQEPDLKIDGEVQANFALNKEKNEEIFPFSELAKHRANTLIFPNLSSGNIGYKLLQEIGDVETLGPILLGMNKPMHVLQLGSTVREIVNMVTIAAADAATREQKES